METNPLTLTLNVSSLQCKTTPRCRTSLRRQVNNRSLLVAPNHRLDYLVRVERTIWQTGYIVASLTYFAASHTEFADHHSAWERSEVGYCQATR